MKRTSDVISRRIALYRTLTIAGGIVLPCLSPRSQSADPDFTPENVLGPFYPLDKPLDKDADLTHVRGRKGAAKGNIIYVSGRVVNLNGEPVKGVNLELWQANSVGRYSHPADTDTSELDPNFQGYAVLKTNRDGEFRFKTIKPGAYPTGPETYRPPHIHFDIKSKTSRLVTQMFFPNEPLNQKDQLFTMLGDYARLAIATPQPISKDMETDSISYGWNVILYEK
jgi:protocatechuate 3,4-dioxygenase, beta subunit